MNKDNKVLDGRTRETGATRELDRIERTPVYKQSRVDVFGFLDPNFRYRIVVDRPGRVARFQLGGWEIVRQDMFTTYSKTNQTHASQDSSVSTKQVNFHNDAEYKTGILMRIPIDQWKEDQAAQHDEHEELLNEIDDDGDIYRAFKLATRQNIRRDEK